MSEEIDITQNLDSLDLTNVETGMPLLPEGIHGVEVIEAKLEPNKKGTGKNLNLKFGLTEATESVEGKLLNVGFPLFHTISMVQTPKYDPRQNLAAFKECFTGTKAGNFFPVEQYIGATGIVRTKNLTSEEFGTQTKLARFVKKG
jgi:hypothetical protein